MRLGRISTGFQKKRFGRDSGCGKICGKLWERLERAGLTGDRLKNLHPETFCGFMNDVLRKKVKLKKT